MWPFWLPDDLKRQIFDRIVDFIDQQSEDILGEEVRRKIRALSTQGSMQNALNDAIQRAMLRFKQEYIETDEDLTLAIIEDSDFWNNSEIRKSLLSLISRPNMENTDKLSKIADRFVSVLPQRHNRKRVDNAVTYLLRLVAEEIWTIPGANEVREIYMLQMQRLSAEALQQQVDLLKTQILATQQIGADIRGALIQLTDTVGQRLLSAPEPQAIVLPPHPWHNLPQRTYTHFVGRQVELDKLTQLLSSKNRQFLITLDGIGGVGKSTLALEIAYHFKDDYEQLPADEKFEAIIWITAKPAILTATGIQPRAQNFRSLSDLFREITGVLEQPDIVQASNDQRRGIIEQSLRGQRTLLIIDNLETVDDEELLTFLRELPEPTKAIITTRHRIDVSYTIRLIGMAEEDAFSLITSEATQKNVELSPEHVSDLYHRTGGIPLAIVWSLALMSLGYGVDSVLRRLGSGHSDIARFCFSESLTHIGSKDAEKMLYALAIFESEVSRHMLGKVTGFDVDEVGRDDALAQLIRLSFVNQHNNYFALLPLTRSFALDQLAQHQDVEQTLRGNWIQCLIEFAKAYNNPYWRQPDRRRLRIDGFHLVTLSAWAQEKQRFDVLLAIIPGLAYYYDLVGQWSDMLAIGQMGLRYASLLGELRTSIFIETHIIASLRSQQGQHEEAEQAMKQALKVANSLNDIEWQCEVLIQYSQILRRSGHLKKALDMCQEAVQLSMDVAENQRVYINANIEFELGKVARDEGDYQSAYSHYVSARNIFRHDNSNPDFNIEHAWGILSNLAYVMQKLGDLNGSAKLYRQVLAYCEEGVSKSHMATVILRLAILEEQCGRYGNALKYAHEALEWSEALAMTQEYQQAQELCKRLDQKP